MKHQGRLAVALGLLVGASSCDFTNYQRIDEDFQFGYTDRSDNTNVYCQELPVIPGGCDEAKWNGDIIVARGLTRGHNYNWAPKLLSADHRYYFIIHKTAYRASPAAQERSDGFEGPFTQHDFDASDPLPKQAFHNTDF